MNEKKLLWEMPDDFFTVKSQPLPEETKRRLKIAAEKANENIQRNNQIYRSSIAHASGYPVSSNSGSTGPSLRKVKIEFLTRIIIIKELF